MMRTSLVLLCLSSVTAVAEGGRILTLNEAVQTATAHQPTMREAQATTDVKRAQQNEARAPLLPQVQLGLGYERRTTNYPPGTVIGLSTTSGGSVTAASPNWNTSNYYPVTTNYLSASQLIYDFEATLGKWWSAEESTRSQEDTEKATLLQVVLTVRTAFFLARANKDLVKVAKDTLDNQDSHLVQTKGFVVVGTQPEISLATAETNRANALVQLITAQNNYDVAKATLNQTMGVEQSTEYDVSDENLPPVPDEDSTTEKLMDEALGARPEVASLEHQIASQRYLYRSVRGGYFPSIGASTTGTEGGVQLSNLVWNWNAQLTLTWNLFQGFLTPSQIAEQNANIVNLEAQRDALRLQVRLQLEQARLAVKAAKATVLASEEALVNAHQQLRLAEGRYQTGVGSIIELGDAQVAQTTAAAQKVQADYSVASARAQLLQALGRP
jgi:outer membrane protein